MRVSAACCHLVSCLPTCHVIR